MVVGRAVIRDTRQGDDAQRTLSQVSMIVAVAPAVAPIVGGWILGWGHWTFIFWCLAAFSMLLLALTWLWLPETHPAQARERAGVARLLREYVAIFLNPRSEEHTSELQSLMRTSYDVFCLKKKKQHKHV